MMGFFGSDKGEDYKLVLVKLLHSTVHLDIKSFVHRNMYLFCALPQLQHYEIGQRDYLKWVDFVISEMGANSRS
jgi:hypothetical protein